VSSIDLQHELRAVRARVDSRLGELVDGGPPRLRDAMRHVALGPGKRLRPTLCLWTYAMLRPAGASPAPRDAVALDTACALELVHAYSLVHDDLPCMDDDALRRGRPTCHVLYGEAVAVLVGDALLNLAYETLLAAAWDDSGRALRVARTLAAAASHRGLLGGQVLDLEAEGEAPTAERLEAIHRAKTGALIGAAIRCGGLVAGAEDAALERLRQIGDDLGLAFQIADDVLDVVGRAEDLGKSPGKDVGAHKMTYPALYGLERSRTLASQHAEAARSALERDFPDSSRMQALAVYFVQRMK